MCGVQTYRYKMSQLYRTNKIICVSLNLINTNVLKDNINKNTKNTPTRVAMFHVYILIFIGKRE